MKAITVNQNGLSSILAILDKNHRMNGSFTASMLAAWASDVENSWAEGNGACFEIAGRDSLTGNPQTFCLDATCFDIYEVEE